MNIRNGMMQPATTLWADAALRGRIVGISRQLGLAALLALPLTFAGRIAHAVSVTLELSLLVDGSSKFDGPNFEVQQLGYAAAFRSAAVQKAVTISPIAVNFIQWSNPGNQLESVGFTLVSSAASASAFATAVEAVPRAFDGWSSESRAINFAARRFTNAFEGARQIINVSGQRRGLCGCLGGDDEVGLNTRSVRDRVLAAGITAINGLAIDPYTAAFYADNVVGGTGSFLLETDTFNGFSKTAATMLTREITNDIPEPASMALLGLGLAALAVCRRET